MTLERKTAVLYVRLTRAESREIRDRAKRAKVPLSQYVRELLFPRKEKGRSG